MRVEVVPGLDGLESLSGAVVIFDVFRASNTILALLSAGARRVVLEADLERARELKQANQDWLLMGERGGVPPAGFDGDNSPAKASALDLTGRNVILTTSAGTQAVHRLGGADKVIFASFANMAAAAELLTALAPPVVNLLPMGLEASSPAEEDDLAAFYLRLALMAEPPVFQPLRERLLACPGADRLRRLSQLDDLEFCTTLDSHALVPMVEFGPLPQAVPWV